MSKVKNRPIMNPPAPNKPVKPIMNPPAPPSKPVKPIMNPIPIGVKNPATLNTPAPQPKPKSPGALNTPAKPKPIKNPALLNVVSPNKTKSAKKAD